MPYKTRKVRGKDCYRVYNTDTKHAFAKCTSKKNAIKQMKLLRAIQFNKGFKTRVTRRRRSSGIENNTL